jgi:hypothetical protein
MQPRPPRLTERSTDARSAAAWDLLRRRTRAAAVEHLLAAGRLLEALPEDPEAHRAAGRTFREAARLRSELREVPA